jgi:hypothetical protein
MKKLAAVGILVLIGLVGLSVAVGRGLWTGSGPSAASQRLQDAAPATSEKTRASSPTDGAGGAAIAAIEQAAAAKKYLFIFFWKVENEQTAAMKKVFEDGVKKAGDRAQSVHVCLTDLGEKGIVEKFGLDRAPMPLALAIAPNGAVMGGFPGKFTEQDLLGAFGTPCTERCMKLLQDGKLVFLCVQNAATKSNGDAMKGVREFKADERFAAATEIVTLDPTDSAETPFLTDLKIDPKTTEAVTVFLAPPGAPIAEFKGATDKAELVATLEKAGSACAGGKCGPGGCGPQK